MNAIPQVATLSPDRAISAPAGKWTVADVEALYQLPLMDLLFRAQQVHRENFNANEIQRSTLLSVKTGGCSEDCGYCSQAARYSTSTEREALMPLDEVIAAAQAAKDKGASRFCMGAAWRGPKDKDLAKVTEMIRTVKSMGLQTCVTLGMLKDGQADELKEAGLDYYNHNLDTDASFYGQVITTHKHADRIDTLGQVREAGIKVCSGGIIGMGESRRNRAALIVQLANLNPAPESVPINNLVPDSRNADGQCRAGRQLRVRAHPGCRADHHADELRAPVGGSPGDVRRAASALLSGRRQLDFLRRQAADHRQSGSGS
jgi:biotin synthase